MKKAKLTNLEKILMFMIFQHGYCLKAKERQKLEEYFDKHPITEILGEE